MAAIPAHIIDLINSPSRLPGTDAEIEAAFWSAYPRFRFLKGLPWQARLLDIGAGSGGLAVWREWQTPLRTDIRMFAIDRERGPHAALYEEWHIADLNDALPIFRVPNFDAFVASHLIEHLDHPETLFHRLSCIAAPGAHIYLEWPAPETAALPPASQLAEQFDYTIQTLNFFDDHTHQKNLSRTNAHAALTHAGFHVTESAEIELGILAQEMIARGRSSDNLTFRQMGLWSAIGWTSMIIARYQPGNVQAL
jgi:2-polyprenyl-3-methyl-5-hydroxy-6-metoxy-1,4-benzoquinol methylase